MNGKKGTGVSPPPDHGFIYLDKRDEWRKRAVRSKRVLKEGLEEAGANDATINDILAEYRRRAYNGYIPSGIRKMDILKAVIDEKIYTSTAAKSEISWVKVRLFFIHLPKSRGAKVIPGSKIIFKEKPHTRGYGNWSVKVHGLGMGDSQMVRLVCNFNVEVKGDDCLCIYAMVPFKVSQTFITNKKTGKISSGIRLEVPRNYDGYIFKNEPIPCAEDCPRRNLWYPLKDFSLSKLSKTSRQSLNVVWPHKNPLKIEMDIMNKQYQMEIQLFRKLSLKLEFVLQGGYDYKVYALKKRDGIKWKTFEAARSSVPGGAPAHP
jgi:hypothetical protein